MGSQRSTAAGRRIRGQGRILEALAENGAVLTGTLESLGEQFGMSPRDLRACLATLEDAGWITTEMQPFGHLTIRLNPDPRDSQRRPPVPRQ
jgi:DNA-binding MarR family transcriptional regulator